MKVAGPPTSSMATRQSFHPGSTTLLRSETACPPCLVVCRRVARIDLQRLPSRCIVVDRSRDLACERPTSSVSICEVQYVRGDAAPRMDEDCIAIAKPYFEADASTPLHDMSAEFSH